MAQTVLGYHESLPQGNIVTINLCWALGVFLAICVAGGVSGAHVNPAVSVAFAIFGKLRWKRLPFFLVGQYLGAFVASVCVYVVYRGMHNNIYYIPVIETSINKRIIQKH